LVEGFLNAAGEQPPDEPVAVEVEQVGHPMGEADRVGEQAQTRDETAPRTSPINSV
jgi:hypothetical protein